MPSLEPSLLIVKVGPVVRVRLVLLSSIKSLSCTSKSDKIAFPVFSTIIVYSTASPTPKNPSPFSSTRTVFVAAIDGSDPI